MQPCAIRNTTNTLRRKRSYQVLADTPVRKAHWSCVLQTGFVPCTCRPARMHRTLHALSRRGRRTRLGSSARQRQPSRRRSRRRAPHSRRRRRKSARLRVPRLMPKRRWAAQMLTPTPFPFPRQWVLQNACLCLADVLHICAAHGTLLSALHVSRSFIVRVVQALLIR
jgi:hypothetical protein